LLARWTFPTLSVAWQEQLLYASSFDSATIHVHSMCLTCSSLRFSATRPTTSSDVYYCCYCLLILFVKPFSHQYNIAHAMG
jgi:hypothetical protein